MNKELKYDTIIIEFKSISSYSNVTTPINMKFCLLPVFEHKIKFAALKSELQNLCEIVEFIDVEIDDNDYVYCEFFYGYRMVKDKYLNLERIIDRIKGFIHSYSDWHEMSIFKLNYTGLIDEEINQDSKRFLDEICNFGTNVIDEKKRIYKNPLIGPERVYKTDYYLIHEIVYNTVKKYENVFNKGNNVYKSIIKNKLIADLLSNDDLVNSIINDKEFMSIIANDQHIKKINGVYFLETG